MKVKLPRPYLSDLCISPKHRRRGLAKALVEKSEHFCKQQQQQQQVQSKSNSNIFLWIRVHESNKAALQMYESLGYHEVKRELDESSQKAKDAKEIVLTLRKDLTV
jgi:ribosomal protein S18 acetylase RimI-like enzyme